MTTTELQAVEKLAWIVRVVMLTKAAMVIAEGLTLNPLQDLILSSRLTAIGLDTIGIELIGERELTDAEKQLGLDLIEALPDDLNTMNQVVDTFKSELEKLR